MKSENMGREESGQVRKRTEVKVKVKAKVKVIFFGPQRTPARPPSRTTAQSISDVRYKRHSLETPRVEAIHVICS